MNQVFIQMSGAPGSGKTTIANAISERIKAVIIDHDVTKSALLNAGVPYLYIECRLENLDELDRRLRSRPRRPTQLTGVYSPPPKGSGRALSGEEVFRDWIRNMKRPAADYLVLDTARPVETCVEEAVAYISAN